MQRVPVQVPQHQQFTPEFSPSAPLIKAHSVAKLTQLVEAHVRGVFGQFIRASAISHGPNDSVLVTFQLFSNAIVPIKVSYRQLFVIRKICPMQISDAWVEALPASQQQQQQQPQKDGSAQGIELNIEIMSMPVFSADDPMTTGEPAGARGIRTAGPKKKPTGGGLMNYIRGAFTGGRRSQQQESDGDEEDGEEEEHNAESRKKRKR